MIKPVLKFFKILLVGNEQPDQKLPPAIKEHCVNIRSIWVNKEYNDFGLERLVRLFLAVSMFAFPGLYIRHFSGKRGLLCRKLFVDLYMCIKVILPVSYFILGITDHVIIAALASYMILETIFYLSSLIFLADEFSNPVSYRRNFTGLIVNYFQICLDFAVIYYFFGQRYADFFSQPFDNAVNAVYFSILTSTTLGFGEITPDHIIGQILVIVQVMISLIFVALFFNVFASGLKKPTDDNPNKTILDS